ncbi:hypothetical protein GCM10007036_10640 [Alsobacter metallidurans]|uniref:Uncharacterized protein n=1 Tax=Alsobacter metallidurans TaxID=340221 RepID=A0A917I5X9_9HYPH|nr:hypothetical protein [Alsobacter metallidurans]GGH12633.1 hypothetical protein GCM10007036_10640 [Alsobacter metallidurans]
MPRPEGGGRPKTTSVFELDIRWLGRNGFLERGAVRRLCQTVNCRVIAEAQIEAKPAALRIRIGERCDWVHLERTEQPLGGERRWFRRDECGRRAAVLYGFPLACRKCRGLAYPSQRETERDRGLRRARKARARVGGSGNLVEPFPPRPKGMHARTYDRLWAAFIQAERRAVEMTAGALLNSSLMATGSAICEK